MNPDRSIDGGKHDLINTFSCKWERKTALQSSLLILGKGSNYKSFHNFQLISVATFEASWKDYAMMSLVIVICLNWHPTVSGKSIHIRCLMSLRNRKEMLNILSPLIIVTLSRSFPRIITKRKQAYGACPVSYYDRKSCCVTFLGSWFAFYFNCRSHLSTTFRSDHYLIWDWGFLSLCFVCLFVCCLFVCLFCFVCLFVVCLFVLFCLFVCLFV